MDLLIRYGWYAVLTAMAGDILVSLILPLFYKEYSIKKMLISALGNPKSPVRTPFNIWMLLEGILFLISLPAIHKLYQPVSAGLTYALLAFITVFAVGSCIFTCFFSVNESKDIVTAASKIHGAGSVIGFMLFLLVPLFIGILSFRSGSKVTGAMSIACFVLSLVFFTLFVMSDKEEFSKTPIANEGLWQRLDLLFMYLPVAIVEVIHL